MSIVLKKYKLDRRVGINILGRPKSRVNARPYPPGQHGKGKVRRKKLSDYGVKLLECKKVKTFYGGLRQGDLSRIVKESINKKTKSDDCIVSILESRLSNFVYRAKWAITPFFARQLISHGKVYVNDNKVDIWSYRVKVGDVITLHKSMHENAHVLASINTNERSVPDYVKVHSFEGQFINLPNVATVQYPTPFNFKLLIEFFSR
jgi:small subunit ribosomal protein S4